MVVALQACLRTRRQDRSGRWPPEVHLIVHVCCTEPFYDVWHRHNPSNEHDGALDLRTYNYPFCLSRRNKSRPTAHYFLDFHRLYKATIHPVMLAQQYTHITSDSSPNLSSTAVPLQTMASITVGFPGIIADMGVCIVVPLL